MRRGQEKGGMVKIREARTREWRLGQEKGGWSREVWLG